MGKMERLTFPWYGNKRGNKVCINCTLILAAGQGTRIKSDLSKVLQKFVVRKW